jgi:hypothetical protein
VQKKKESAAHLSMGLSGHHDTVGFLVYFFSTQKKECSAVFCQIGPKVTRQKSVKTSKKSVRRLFRQVPSHAKAANKIGKVLSLGHSSWVWARIA